MARRLPKVLSKDEQVRFLKIFNRRYPTPHRNWLMCRLMLEVGLRSAEVRALQPDHLDMLTCRLIVREGKGAKDRVLWITDDLRDAIGKWLERRPASDYLFPTNQGTMVQGSDLRRMVKRTARKAEIAEAAKVSPHSLRHTFASDLYARTHNLRLVQAALGHSTIQTTEIYTHLVNGELENALRQNV